MNTPFSVQSRPIVLSRSVESQVYGLFALAIGLTVVGVYLGALAAPVLFGSGLIFLLLIVEIVLISTSRRWMDSSPLNYILFGAFPILSGMTITPYLMSVVAGYANGTSILLNALLSTAGMVAAAAVVARATGWNLSGLGRVLFMSVIGLIVLGLLQIFIPSLRTDQMELIISGAGIVIFALFTAYDLQRTQALSRNGVNPFMLALSLYLDIFNLFLYVLRFMTALSGQRR